MRTSTSFLLTSGKAPKRLEPGTLASHPVPPDRLADRPGVPEAPSRVPSARAVARTESNQTGGGRQVRSCYTQILMCWLAAIIPIWWVDAAVAIGADLSRHLGVRVADLACMTHQCTMCGSRARMGPFLSSMSRRC